MKENIIKLKSFRFALRSVRLGQYLRERKREFILSKQIVRSGTSIGAMVRESEHAESRRDFTHKMSIALKEANETLYWLELLHETGYMNDPEFRSMRAEIVELLNILVAIVRTARRKE